jgi:hypothetical protein
MREVPPMGEATDKMVENVESFTGKDISIEGLRLIAAQNAFMAQIIKIPNWKTDKAVMAALRLAAATLGEYVRKAEKAF